MDPNSTAVEVIDLNLYPSPPPSPPRAAANPSLFPFLLTPKTEPKGEPIFFETPTFHAPPHPSFTQPTAAQPHLPHPVAQFPSSENNLYSDFTRITNLFNEFLSENAADFSDNSRAIVPLPPPPPSPAHENNQLSSRVKRYRVRSGELVRVAEFSPQDHLYSRTLVRKTRMLYDSLRVLATSQDHKHDNRRTRGDLKAAQLMREADLWLNRDKRIVGSIPGIFIGDLFFFRMELCVVGLHGHIQAGIDYLPGSQSSNGEPVATSVIVSGGYEDDEDSGDVIMYTGHGGQDKTGKQVDDQRLECGNLAMERSMAYNIEVRVIRGFKYEGSVSGKVYVYDGLYNVVDTWFERGKSGYGVYKFKLTRIENQASMGSSTLRLAEKLRSNPLEARPFGYVSLDLSSKRESSPVLFFNDMDGNYEPLNYDYLVRTVFPHFVYASAGGDGCDCFGFCSDDCFCAKRNGGDFAYDSNGILIRGKPLIFECGRSCRCSSACRNRTTQNGIKHRFEVFRSNETDWGVRCLDLIQAGSFVCEYAGLALTPEQVQILTMNGDNLIYPRRFGERWKEWGDLSRIFSDYVCPDFPAVPPLDFALDVSKVRNLACYMSHSTSPNVFVQFVLNDHDNVAFPHLMLFAMENIPPLTELSLDYGVADELAGKLSICN